MEQQFLLEAPSGPFFIINCSPTVPMAQLPIITDMMPPSPTVPADPMEALWHSQFDQLFNQFFPFSWQLIPEPLVDYCVTDWNTHSDSAKVRFLCQICGHGWTSMKGRVVFWHQIDPVEQCGTVVFSLFGQKCQECSRDGFDHFTPAMWYQEEVVKVLHNIYSKVGQTYFGFQQPWYMKNRRHGKPRSQHASELCQACQLGVCSSSMIEHYVNELRDLKLE